MRILNSIVLPSPPLVPAFDPQDPDCGAVRSQMVGVQLTPQPILRAGLRSPPHTVPTTRPMVVPPIPPSETTCTPGGSSPNAPQTTPDKARQRPVINLDFPRHKRASASHP